MSIIKEKQVIVTCIVIVTMMVIVTENCTFIKRSKQPRYIDKMH